MEDDVKVSQPHSLLQKGGADCGLVTRGTYVASVSTVFPTHGKDNMGSFDLYRSQEDAPTWASMMSMI